MSAEIQLQMRRNMEEMHSAIDDLTAWTGEIGKKDRRLRGFGPEEAKHKQDAESDDEEDAREIAEAKAELAQLIAQEARHKVEPVEESTPTAVATGEFHGTAAAAATAERGLNQRSRTENYGAWDKFDVDGEVERLEAQAREQEALRQRVAHLENQSAQARVRRQEARNAAASEALRAQGNTAFGAAQYEDAVEAYTAALELTPRSAVLYANRALALLKLRLAAEADEDCTAALEIDSKHVKALLRRAQARIELSKYDGALEDLECALELEPRNGAARRHTARTSLIV